MTNVREEELIIVNGGAFGGRTLGGSKFNEGDVVISKANPDFGVGTVTGKKYFRGWHYYVESAKGSKIYTIESDLEPVLFQQPSVQ